MPARPSASTPAARDESNREQLLDSRGIVSDDSGFAGTDVFDTIIIGAGSAGCVLANRLSADPARKVLLLEAGPRDWHPFIHMPAGLAKLVGKKGVNWDYDTAPEAQLDSRTLWWLRGKVLGGSSSINAMCYIRGVARDYDDWAARAPTARLGRVCRISGAAKATVLQDARDDAIRRLHGRDGPLSVSDLRFTNPLSQAFIEAGVQAGMRRNPDFNGPAQHGVGFYQVTQRDGARCCSAAVAYLDPGETAAQPHRAHRRAGLAHHLRRLGAPAAWCIRCAAGLPTNRHAR